MRGTGQWSPAIAGMLSQLLPQMTCLLLTRSMVQKTPTKVLVDLPIYRPNDAQAPPLAEAKPFSVAVLHLSEDQVAALKSTRGVRLSTFKAVAAHTWRCVCKARALGDDEEPRLYMAIDSRTRLDPPMPRGFLGNAAFRMLARARVGNVVADPLERTADRIHEATSTVGYEHVRSLVDFLELQGDLRTLARLSRCQTATDLCAVSWLRLPTHETDFGSGGPVLVRRACLRGSGWVYISRSPGKDGGVSLTLSLETEHMPAFQKAFYQGRIQKSLM